MSVTTKNGNILNATEYIIAHQVNGLGIMGGGLAKQIKQKHPNVYTRYHRFVKQHDTPEELLGTNLMVASNGENIWQFDKTQSQTKIISNLFGQARIGTSQKQTDEQALRQAFEHLAAYAQIDGLSIALPQGIGCGLGGGDWNEIRAIIQDVFEDCDVTIYRFNG